MNCRREGEWEILIGANDANKEGYTIKILITQWLKRKLLNSLVTIL